MSLLGVEGDWVNDGRRFAFSKTDAIPPITFSGRDTVFADSDAFGREQVQLELTTMVTSCAYMPGRGSGKTQVSHNTWKGEKKQVICAR